jgi:hypothetical protein
VIKTIVRSLLTRNSRSLMENTAPPRTMLFLATCVCGL